MPRYLNTLTKEFSCVIEAKDLEDAIIKSNSKDITLEPTGSKSMIEQINIDEDKPKTKCLPVSVNIVNEESEQ